MPTFDQAQAIINKYNGKYAGVIYGGVYQCVAWAAVFSAELGGPSFLPTPVTGGARDIYEQFPASLRGFYDRIPNSPSFVPQTGDLVIWTAMPGNQWGHIAVASGEGNTSWFYSYDQNFIRGQVVTKTKHNYSYVLGVLRPKNMVNTPVSTGASIMKFGNDDNSRGLLRIIHSEMEGWPYHEVHAGKFDKQFLDSWIGQDVIGCIWEKWNKNGNWRNIREAALAYYNQKGANDKLVADLKAQIEAQQKELTRLGGELTTALSDDASDDAKMKELEEQLKNMRANPQQNPNQSQE